MTKVSSWQILLKNSNEGPNRAILESGRLPARLILASLGRPANQSFSKLRPVEFFNRIGTFETWLADQMMSESAPIADVASLRGWSPFMSTHPSCRELYAGNLQPRSPGTAAAARDIQRRAAPGTIRTRLLNYGMTAQQR